jgi:hypothetical protein
MSEEQLNASLDAEGAKRLEEAEDVEDVELTDEELAGVAGGFPTHTDPTPKIKYLKYK